MSQSVKEIDLHGMNSYQAQIAIEAALRRSWGLYKIRLIHGYHQGTRLRDFIAMEYQDDPRLTRLEQVTPGITELHLREL
ncbi:MAG: Smr/MutS family protein [Eubacteriales bacterium]|nr:Smr/MutS family protein [Eubacteriales bacterium]